MWEAFVSGHPDALKLRGKKFDLYDRIAEVIGDGMFTGSYITTKDGSMNLRDELTLPTSSVINVTEELIDDAHGFVSPNASAAPKENRSSSSDRGSDKNGKFQSPVYGPKMEGYKVYHKVYHNCIYYLQKPTFHVRKARPTGSNRSDEKMEELLIEVGGAIVDYRKESKKQATSHGDNMSKIYAELSLPEYSDIMADEANSEYLIYRLATDATLADSLMRAPPDIKRKLLKGTINSRAHT